MHEVADKYDCKKYIKLQHSVQSATWNEGNGKWDLKIKDASGSIIGDEADVFINASGVLK